jgi:hypothetical protein
MHLAVRFEEASGRSSKSRVPGFPAIERFVDLSGITAVGEVRLQE